MLNGASVKSYIGNGSAWPHPIQSAGELHVDTENTHTLSAVVLVQLWDCRYVFGWGGREGGNPSSFVSFVEYKAEKMSLQRKSVGEWQGPREVRE